MTTLQTLLNDYQKHQTDKVKERAEKVRAEMRDKVLEHLATYAPYGWQEVKHESGFYETKFAAQIEGVRFEVEYNGRGYTLTAIIGESSVYCSMNGAERPNEAYKTLCHTIHNAYVNDTMAKVHAEKKARPRFQVLSAIRSKDEVLALLDDGYQCIAMDNDLWLALYKPE